MHVLRAKDVCGSSRKSLGICRGVCGSSRKSLGICRGVCGSPASLSAFTVAFAGVPASLSAFTVAFAGVPQVSRHLPRGVCGHRRSLPGASADAGEVCRVPEGPPAGRVGAYCIRPPGAPARGGCMSLGVHPFGPVGPFDVGLLGAAPRWFVGAGTRVGAYCIRPTGRHHRWRIHVPGVWSFIPCGMFGGAYAIRPYRGTCIRYVHSAPFGGVRDASQVARYPAKFAGVRRRPRPASLPRQRPSADAPGQLPCPGRGRSDRNKCTSSSCFCLRILVRLRGQRSMRKTCVSIRNITYFIPPVRMAGMFILQVPYLLPISAVCFPGCSRNPRAVNNPSRRN